MKRFVQFKDLFFSDARRYYDDDSFSKLNRKGWLWGYFMIRGIPGLRFSYWMRLCQTLQGSKPWLPLYIIALNRYNHCKYHFGISIPFNTQIGKGFYIGHFGCIVVNPSAIIGKNVNISQGVTIGKGNRGVNAGVATIGNEVYIGPGAKIIGAVHIGDNVAIGANAVVTHDIPDNAVAAGIPAKVISMKGANGYVNRKTE